MTARTTAAPAHALRRWGGARAGAGRPKRGAIASEPHKQRPALVASQPLHVIARVVRAAGALHDRAARRAIDRALRRSLGRNAFRIVHLRISSEPIRASRAQRRGASPRPAPTLHRIELVVEARDRIALARGMQGFQVAAAKHLNRLRGRSGAVFADRYRARPLHTFGAVRRLIGPGWRVPGELPALPQLARPETPFLVDLAADRHDSS